MRPIDADELPFTDIVIDNGLIPDDDRILELPPTVRAVLLSDLNSAPTIDVQPVVHAHWVREPEDTAYENVWTCSNCGEEFIQHRKPKFIYCPHCGAKMDEANE